MQLTYGSLQQYAPVEAARLDPRMTRAARCLGQLSSKRVTRPPEPSSSRPIIFTFRVPFKNKVLASSKISTATDLSSLIPWRWSTSLAPRLFFPRRCRDETYVFTIIIHKPFHIFPRILDSFRWSGFNLLRSSSWFLLNLYLFLCFTCI